MTTVYKNNIPYADNNNAVQVWATAQVTSAVTSAVIAVDRGSTVSLVINGTQIGLFDGAPTAMTVLYEAFVANGGKNADFGALNTITPSGLDMTGINMNIDFMIIAEVRDFGPFLIE